ncbi:MAG: hypothetical protein GY854_14005 [Deltaproteobacteria bacterium]|nr:hypothetical protein [Deltaproteobacteria bacterium]
MRISIIGYCAAFFALSCSSGDGESVKILLSDGGTAYRSPEGDVVSAGEDHSAGKGEATFGQGRNTVFGLVILEGMVPAKGPDKVYRFEGEYPIVAVISSVREQIYGQTTEREGKGFLLRHARIRRIKRGSPRPELAIRIFQGEKGATIDVWLEKEYAKNPDDAHDRGSTGRTTKMTPAAAAKRRAAAQKTIRAMQKVRSGEMLSREDMESLH